MKIKKAIAVVSLTTLLPVLAMAGGKTGACTPPQGQLSIAPNQVCNGKQVVAIGKDVTLTATGLKDKDCYCGSAVQDTIDTTTHVKWSVGGGIGTFTGGDTGTPKTWTAPPEIHTSLAVRLQVDDDATAPHTTDDGGFLEVANTNLDVVVPDDATWTTTKATPTCPAGQSANIQHLVDTVKRTGCNVDFKDLNWTEDNVPKNTNTGCGFGPGTFGPTAILHIGAGNTVDGGAYDNVGLNCNAGTYPANCTSGWALDWKTSRSASYTTGTWYTVITRTYTFKNPTAAPVSSSGMVVTATK